MTCGNQNWEPTSTQITVNAFQTNACKRRNRVCFILVLFIADFLQSESNQKQLECMINVKYQNQLSVKKSVLIANYSEAIILYHRTSVPSGYLIGRTATQTNTRSTDTCRR